MGGEGGSFFSHQNPQVFPKRSPFPVCFCFSLIPSLCFIVERAFENNVRCVLKSLISLTDLGLGFWGLRIWEALGENETGALQTVDAPFFSLSFWVVFKTCNGPTPTLSLTFFGLV